MGSTTILNEQGDTTIAWSSERDAEMAEIIARKIKQGVTFFIIEDDGVRRELEAKTAKAVTKQVGERRRLAIRDEDFAAFVASGAGIEMSSPKAPMRRTRQSKDPAEVAASHSVGVQQRRAG